jgi:phosphate:Na+ symporter
MVAILLADPGLSRVSRALGAALRRAADPSVTDMEPTRLARLFSGIEARTRQHRRATLLHEHVGLISVAEMFDRTDAMRWLSRVAEHASRIVHYKEQAVKLNGPEAPETPGPTT